MHRTRLLVTALLLDCIVSILIITSAAAEDPAFDKHFADAKSALKAGKYHDAINSFKKASNLQGNSCFGCFMGMAVANFKLTDYRNALEAVDRAIGTAANDADRAAAHNLKGNILTDGARSPKDLVTGEVEYRTAIQLDGSVASYHMNCAIALIRELKDDDAKPELEACLAANPSLELAKRAKAILQNPRRARENFAPDFKIKSLTGEELTLDQFAGKVLVIDFWATWCPPCRALVGELKELTRKYPPDKLVLVSVSADEDEDAWREFIAKKHMDWMQYRDSDHQLLDAFLIRSFPTYLVIDGDGIIRQRISGMNPMESVVHRLQATLKGMPQLAK